MGFCLYLQAGQSEWEPDPVKLVCCFLKILIGMFVLKSKPAARRGRKVMGLPCCDTEDCQTAEANFGGFCLVRRCFA